MLAVFTSLLIETGQFNMATGRLELAIFPPSSNVTLNNDIKMAKAANMANMANDLSRDAVGHGSVRISVCEAL